jgi:hypothetical protein
LALQAENGPVAGNEVSRQYPDQGGFAAAIRAHQADALRSEMEIEILEKGPTVR